MAAIVKANSSMLAGNLVILKRNFSAADNGQMNYAVDYVCLSSFASRWTPFFKTGAQPPTALPANMLLLKLTKTPTLVNLETETVNGLTYFRASYSAGVATDVTITESSEIRNFSYTVTFAVGYTKKVFSFNVSGNPRVVDEFVQTGGNVVQMSYDYVSITQSAASQNAQLPAVRGSTGARFNFNGSGNMAGRTTVVETTSKTKNLRGEMTFSKSSTGIIQ